MQGKLLSLVPVVAERGKAERNAGALQRYSEPRISPSRRERGSLLGA